MCVHVCSACVRVCVCVLSDKRHECTAQQSNPVCEQEGALECNACQ